MDRSAGSLIAVSYEVTRCNSVADRIGASFVRPKEVGVCCPAHTTTTHAFTHTHTHATHAGTRAGRDADHAGRPGPGRLPRDCAGAGGSQAQEGRPDPVPERRSVATGLAMKWERLTRLHTFSYSHCPLKHDRRPRHQDPGAHRSGGAGVHRRGLHRPVAAGPGPAGLGWLWPRPNPARAGADEAGRAGGGRRARDEQQRGWQR